MSELRVKKIIYTFKETFETQSFKRLILNSIFSKIHSCASLLKDYKRKNRVFRWIHFYDCFVSACVASSTIGARLEVLGCSNLTQ